MKGGVFRMSNGLALPMHSNRTEQKQKFIEMRARGYPYSKISKELSVSKATLTAWSKVLSSTLIPPCNSTLIHPTNL